MARRRLRVQYMPVRKKKRAPVSPLVMFPSIQAQGRYLSMLFPAFIILACGLRQLPLALYALAGLSLVALCGYAAFFTGGFGLP